jgi:hypothetical protein
MLKLNFKNKKYYFNKFLNKNILKNNHLPNTKKIILSNEAVDISREKRGKRKEGGDWGKLGSRRFQTFNTKTRTSRPSLALAKLNLIFYRIGRN